MQPRASTTVINSLISVSCDVTHEHHFVTFKAVAAARVPLVLVFSRSTLRNSRQNPHHPVQVNKNRCESLKTSQKLHASCSPTNLAYRSKSHPVRPGTGDVQSLVCPPAGSCTEQQQPGSRSRRQLF